MRDFDYTQSGYYFVTICTHERQCVLGNIIDGRALLSNAGKIASDCWQDLANHYAHIDLDEFVVMPNHLHGIIVLSDSGEAVNAQGPRAGFKPAPTRRHSLSEIIRAFKTFSGRRINRIRNRTGEPVWQRNYYERVIRNEKTLLAAREYIVNNPAKWSEDKYNPGNF